MFLEWTDEHPMTVYGDCGRSAQTGWHSTHERLVADSSDESTEGSIGLTGATSWLTCDTDHLCLCSAICLLQFFLCTRSDAVQQRFCSVLAGVSAKWSCSYLVLADMGTHLIIWGDGFQFLSDVWWLDWVSLISLSTLCYCTRMTLHMNAWLLTFVMSQQKDWSSECGKLLGKWHNE